MKYVSIDIESTGLNIEKCKILSIGAAIEDTNNVLPIEEIPKFHCIIKSTGFYAEPVAMEMNMDLIHYMNRYTKAKTQDEKNDIVHETGMQFLDEEKVVEELFKWLVANNADPEIKGISSPG